ncbi:tryptorubin family RiPP precursor [Streptomyces sp. NPDC048516]|uniref:tryptorubin family RiPP precursor n=1 Tax=Streptomyces sp. NPDC048516 TaxID=3365565 RepID=UPI00371513A5
MSHLTHSPDRSSLSMAAEMNSGNYIRSPCLLPSNKFSFTTQMEVLMKLVRIVKKFRPEKSLKAYAWYDWI